MATTAPQGARASKLKTKAKQRYLRAKKDRKKLRRAAAARPAREDDGSDDDAAPDGEHGDGTQEPAGPPPERKKKKRHGADAEAQTARPRKRHRPAEAGDGDGDGDDDDGMAPTPPRTPTPPPPPAVLPVFPAPARPDAPTRAELAAQGLDSALARAQLVDPARTMPLPPPDADDPATMGLSARTRRRLGELGVAELFAVQCALLPLLLPADPLGRALYAPYAPPRDVCVSAPTGSGKTLAYVLPIVEVLSARIVTRLRALVVLPTRDLVVQVRETFEAVGKGRGLKIASATGQHSFAHEQAQLVDKTPSLQGGASRVDILICTPGRLMDHLNGTPKFSLQHLRFLVIDEADRLLAQSFQDWLAQVLAATRPPAHPNTNANTNPAPRGTIPRPDACAPAFLRAPRARTDLDEPRAASCQKLLFSATLMSDPGTLAALELRSPQYVVVADGVLGVAMEQFSVPATLTEHMVVCEAARKPLVLFHLVRAERIAHALVFAKSAEAAQRLVQLFAFFEAARAAAQGTRAAVVRAYSSDLGAAERRTVLERFRAREIDILVCSDLVARGIDIERVAHVVNYDAPVDMRKYVHRVGRTARAGRAGDAWTLVEEQEARYFKDMMKAAGHADAVRRVRVAEAPLAPLVPFYQTALAQLKAAYARVN